MRSRTYPATAGFSLVEILVAIVILGFGLVGMSQAITTALSASQDAEHHTTAVMLAAGQMEELVMDPLLTAGENEGVFEAVFPGYRWKTSVVETDQDGLLEATVSIEKGESTVSVFELKTLVFIQPMTSSEEESLRASRTRRGGGP